MFSVLINTSINRHSTVGHVMNTLDLTCDSTLKSIQSLQQLALVQVFVTALLHGVLLSSVHTQERCGEPPTGGPVYMHTVEHLGARRQMTPGRGEEGQGFVKKEASRNSCLSVLSPVSTH